MCLTHTQKQNIADSLETYLEKVDPPFRAFHRIADRMEPSVRLKVLAALGLISITTDPEIVSAGVDTERFDTAMNAIVAGTLISGFQQAAAQAASDAAGTLEDTIPSLRASGALPQGISLEASLTLSDEAAEIWARNNSARLITAIGDESRKAVQQTIETAIREGMAPRKSARVIRDIVGLNAKQAGALAKFRRTLETQKKPFAQSRINQMVRRQRDRMLKFRSESIARTETIAAVNAAQQETMIQGINDGLIDTTLTKKIWVVTPDDRLCPFCEPMAGQVIEITGSFESGEKELEDGETRSFGNVGHPPLHPLCRCSVGLVTLNNPKTITTPTVDPAARRRQITNARGDVTAELHTNSRSVADRGSVGIE